MTVEQYISKVDQFLANINEALNGCVLVAANSLSNSIAQRIQSTGTNEKGTPYKPYSTNKMPAFVFDKTARTVGGSAVTFVESKKKKGEMISYADFRKGAGRQINHRSLLLTGEMWNSFKARPSGTLECIVEFNNAANQKKAQDNAKIIGDFVQPSMKEIELAYEAFDEQLQKEIERIGL